MPRTLKNLLRNPSLEKGRDLPAAWEWLVVSGSPAWEFTEGRAGAESRSVRILQDGRGSHGEFRQVVPCKEATRYRLQAWIRFGIEGSGSQSGANLYLRSLAAGKEVHDMYFRPFFVGREDWRLWSAEYVTPAGADALIVSFDMRAGCGAAAFDDLALFEVPEPLVRSMPLATPVKIAESPKPVRSAVVVGADAAAEHAAGILRIVLGAEAVTLSPPRLFRPAEAERSLVLFSLKEFARPFGRGMRVEKLKAADQQPCARITSAGYVTRGFAPGDVIAWSRFAPDSGEFVQERILTQPNTLAMLHLEVVAESADGLPLILYRPEKHGGTLVMDIEMLRPRPTVTGEENLAATILMNALGRPQVSTGRFVHPGYPLYSYEQFTEELRAATAACPSLRLREEGRSVAGKPVWSLSVGREDAPAFYVDCGIHSDEWAPCFGALLYALRLARAFEAAEPWARALLKDLKLVTIPLLSPDGWENHVRYIRGLDLNRNFPLNWADFKGGWKGSGPISEPESRRVAELFRRERVVAAVNWHETTANAHWVGFPRADGRYRKYALSIPAIFRQIVEPREFLRQAATWTQITDPRNFEWHYTDSTPYIRNYGPQHVPYELFYADSLGIDGLTVEQYGNSDLSSAASPQRTETTAEIIEMLFGLQIGLVARNVGSAVKKIAVPIVADDAGGTVTVYDASGDAVSRGRLASHNGVALVKAAIPPEGVLVAELANPPWRRGRKE